MNRLVFTLSSGKGERKNPQNHVNPVEYQKQSAEKTIEDVVLQFVDITRYYVHNGASNRIKPKGLAAREARCTQTQVRII
ncbi:MAG: hypothetical protein AVO38_15830 [delta proteobacterium ML8_D]|nr:MAG: hypothetical protein AVO38_15830 [delta proteobacterium ML8_D]